MLYDLDVFFCKSHYDRKTWFILLILLDIIDTTFGTVKVSF